MSKPDITINEDGWYICIRNYMEYCIDETISYEDSLLIDLHYQNDRILLVGIEIRDIDINKNYNISDIRYYYNKEICFIDMGIKDNINTIKDDKLMNYGIEIYKNIKNEFVGLVVKRVDENLLDMFSEFNCK